MPTNNKVTIEIPIDVAQEVHSTVATMAKKLAWILENQKSNRPNQIEDRQRKLESATKIFSDALNSRAKLRAVK